MAYIWMDELFIAEAVAALGHVFYRERFALNKCLVHIYLDWGEGRKL